MSEEPGGLAIVHVVTHPDQGLLVGLHERDAAHPPSADFPEGGEIFVAGQGQAPVEVALTPAVVEALRQRRLLSVTTGGEPVPPWSPGDGPPIDPPGGGGRPPA